MARYGNGRRQGGGYGGVVLVLLLFLVAAGAGAYWVWSREDVALTQLRLEADVAALHDTVAFPTPQAGSTGGGSETDGAGADRAAGGNLPNGNDGHSDTLTGPGDTAGAAQPIADQPADASDMPASQEGGAEAIAAQPDGPVDAEQAGQASSAEAMADGATPQQQPDATNLTVTGSGDAAPRALPPPGRPEPPSISAPGPTVGVQADAQPDSGGATDAEAGTPSAPGTTTVTQAAEGGSASSSEQSASVSISELMRGATGAAQGGAPSGQTASATSADGSDGTANPPSTEPTESAAEPPGETDDPLADQLAQLSGIAGDGARMATVMPPRELNAEPFLEPRDRPRIAIIVGGWPADTQEAEALMAGLPSAATLAISPAHPEATRLINRARVAGHEVMITLPFDGVDSAGVSLALDSSGQENVARLDAILSGADRAVGLLGVGDGRFLNDATAIGPVLTQVALDGYLFVTGPGNPHETVARLADRIGLPTAGPSVDLTANPSRGAVDAALSALADRAEREGSALATADVTDALVTALADWQDVLDTRGISLAPITAIVDTPR